MFLAVIGAAGIAGYKLLSAWAQQVEASAKNAHQMRQATAPVRDLGNLEWDEDQGVYRPRPKRET